MTVYKPLILGVNGDPAELDPSFELCVDNITPDGSQFTVKLTANPISLGQGLALNENSLSLGHDSLSSTTTGEYNFALGNQVGTLIEDGSFNILTGIAVSADLRSGDRNVVYGYNISGITSADFNVILGADIVAGNHNNQILIGQSVVPEGAYHTVIGSSSQTNAHIFGLLKIGDGTDSTKTATFDCSGITTGTNRTITVPNASGTLVLGGGTCTGASSGTNTGDQTSVTGNAGTATALQTARTIYGNSFDGTANLSQVITSTYGGTGNGFTKFSGPTTSERTKTLRDADDTVLELGGSYTPTGTWTNLTLVTPVLGTPQSGSLVNCTGLPVATGISGLGTGVATALAVNVGTAGAFVVNGGAMGTPSSGTVTNLTGTASININGTVGATTPAAGTFTNLTVNGNTIIGDAPTDALTLNAAVITVPTTLVLTKTQQVGVAETILTLKVSDSGSTCSFTNNTSNIGAYAPCIDAIMEAGFNTTAFAFNATKGDSSTTNPAMLILYRYNSGSGNTDLPAGAVGFELRNRATTNFEFTAGIALRFAGGATSPTVEAATVDKAILCGFDRVNTRHTAAGNRLLALQTERGSPIYFGDDAIDFAATTGLLSVNGTDIASLTSTSSTWATSLLSSHATGGVGYTTGAGGAVTQITSRTTGVTVNKLSGNITLVSAAGSTTPQSFTVTNSACAANDVPWVVQKSGTDKYRIDVTAVAAGSFVITYATLSGTTTEQPVFNFVIIKGANS